MYSSYSHWACRTTPHTCQQLQLAVVNGVPYLTAHALWKRRLKSQSCDMMVIELEQKSCDSWECHVTNQRSQCGKCVALNVLNVVVFLMGRCNLLICMVYFVPPPPPTAQRKKGSVNVRFEPMLLGTYETSAPAITNLRLKSKKAKTTTPLPPIITGMASSFLPSTKTGMSGKSHGRT